MLPSGSMELSPALIKILSFLAGLLGAFVAVTYLKGTELYIPALLASGALLGVPVPVKNDDKSQKELVASVKTLLTSLPPPAPSSGVRFEG